MILGPVDVDVVDFVVADIVVLQQPQVIHSPVLVVVDVVDVVVVFTADTVVLQEPPGDTGVVVVGVVAVVAADRVVL